MFDTPRLEFGAIAEYDVASGEQTVGRFRILSRDFGFIGFARPAWKIMGWINEMVTLCEPCDLFVA